MKKIVITLFLITALISCSSDSQNNDILPYVQVNETINLDLPEGNDIQVPGGWTYISGGLKGIIVYNINGRDFLAYERAAPHIKLSACSQMIVENNFRMKCPCDDAEFNLLQDGAPITPGIKYSARRYLVTNLNGTILRITNF